MQAQHQELLNGDAPSGQRASALDRVGCELIADSLRAGRPVRMRAGGSSMLPVLWPGDELTVTPAGFGSIPSPGEIVLYARDGRLFAHRLVHQAIGAAFITRGDFLDDNDPPVPASEILGTVTAAFRRGREVPIGATRRSIFATMLALAFRRFDLSRRLALKAHFARRRLWSIGQAQCRP